MRDLRTIPRGPVRKMVLILVALLLPVPAGSTFLAEGMAAPPQVTYVSSSSVYVSAGAEEGVAVGDRLAVVRDGTLVAELEVKLTSPHKADCKRVDT